MQSGTMQRSGLIVGAVIGLVVGGALSVSSAGVLRAADGIPLTWSLVAGFTVAGAIGGWFCALGALLSVTLLARGRGRLVSKAAAGAGAGCVAAIVCVLGFGAYDSWSVSAHYVAVAATVSAGFVAVASGVAWFATKAPEH